MEKVAILMTTFNGSTYLEQQLDSITNQSYTNWTLYIRDDNSTDSTLNIINKYAHNDKRIIVVPNHANFHGAYINFFYLLKYMKTEPKYDYYFFCDQDDVWKSNKISTLISQFNQTEIPTLIYSDLTTIDQLGNIINRSLHDIMDIDLKNKKQLFFVHAYVWGCTAAFNSALFEQVPIPEIEKNYDVIKILSHDSYYAKFALILGKVHFCNEQLVLYRRHDENVTDTHKFKLNLFDIVKKGTTGFQNLSKTHARVYKQSLFMIEQLKGSDRLNDDLLDIKDVIDRGGVFGVRYFIKNNIKRKQKSRVLGQYLTMLFSSYKAFLKE